jgi:hypothetical protein
MWYSGIDRSDCKIRAVLSVYMSVSGMKKTVYTQAEAALDREAKKLAESQLRFTNPERLAATIMITSSGARSRSGSG